MLFVIKRLRTQALLIFALFATCAFGQEKTAQKWVSRVEVDVSADDGEIKQQVNSYISRELRSLGDVEIGDGKPYLRLSVLAVKLTSVPGYSLGFMLSVVVMRPVNLDFLKTTCFSHLDAKGQELCEGLTKDSEVMLGHFVRIGGSQELQNLCKGAVAKIDNDYLDPERKGWQQFQDSLRSRPTPNK
jgi:hypothetical protein